MGNNFLNMKQIEIHLFIKLSICDFQVRQQSWCMPKNLILSVTARAQLLYAMFNGKVRSLEEANFRVCILFKFSTNWLFWNHLKMQHGTELSLEFSSLRSLEETRILVSSANRMVWEVLFMMHEKSLIHMLKSNGPKTEPFPVR